MCRVGKSGISTDKAIRVIVNANIASLKDITCSTFINGVNDPEDVLNPIGKMRLYYFLFYYWLILIFIKSKLTNIF
ncbi:MAG TPA: hypothetical protein VF242_07070 [Nitrososphaeraceae archaeon]